MSKAYNYYVLYAFEHIQIIHVRKLGMFCLMPLNADVMYRLGEHLCRLRFIQNAQHPECIFTCMCSLSPKTTHNIETIGLLQNM